MRKMPAWVILLVACGKSDAPRDWSGVALDDKVASSVGTAKFSIQLPKGWKLQVNEQQMKGWRPDVADYIPEPSVTVGYVQQPPQNIDEYIELLTFDGTPTVDKKLLDENHLVVVAHTADTVKVDYMTHKGDTYVGCSAFQMRPGGVAKPKATQDWLEKLCDTLVIE